MSPRATVRKCDYHLCISTIILWEHCTEKSNNISVLKQQVQTCDPSSKRAALKQTAVQSTHLRYLYFTFILCYFILLLRYTSEGKILVFAPLHLSTGIDTLQIEILP